MTSALAHREALKHTILKTLCAPPASKELSERLVGLFPNTLAGQEQLADVIGEAWRRAHQATPVQADTPEPSGWCWACGRRCVGLYCHARCQRRAQRERRVREGQAVREGKREGDGASGSTQ